MGSQRYRLRPAILENHDNGHSACPEREGRQLDIVVAGQSTNLPLDITERSDALDLLDFEDRHGAALVPRHDDKIEDANHLCPHQVGQRRAHTLQRAHVRHDHDEVLNKVGDHRIGAAPTSG